MASGRTDTITMDSGRVGTTTARVSLLMTSLLLPNAVLPDIPGGGLA